MSQQPWSRPDQQPEDDGPPPGWGQPPAPHPGWGQPPPSPPGWGQPPPSPPGWGQPFPSPPGWGQPPGWRQPPAVGWGAPGAAGNDGIVPLRPLSLGDIYDGALRAVRFNPKAMIGFSALVIALATLVITPVQAWLTPTARQMFRAEEATSSADVARQLDDTLTAAALPAITYFLVVTVVTALLIRCVDAAVRGEKVSPGQLWVITRGRVPAAFGLALALLLITVLVVGALAAPGVVLLLVADSKLPGALLLGGGGLAGVLIAVALATGWFALAAPALLLEDLGVPAALRRSARLVRRSFWRVLGITLLTSAVAGVLSSFLTLPTTVLSYGVSFLLPADSYWASLLSVTVANVGQVLSGAVAYPFSAAVTALLYLDLRMRREGLDVRLMSRQ